MSFLRVAPVGFQRFYRRFDWSRHLWPMAQTAADVPGAGGGELRAARIGACVRASTHFMRQRHPLIVELYQRHQGKRLGRLRIF